MKRILLLLLLVLTSVVCMACGKKATEKTDAKEESTSEADILQLLDDGKLAMCHEEYDIAVDCYKKVLDMEPDNLTARYSLEDVFEQTINKRDLELSQDIYTYITNLESNGDSLSKLQGIIEEYDETVLYSYVDCLAEAFLSDENKSIKELSGIDMEINTFINAYDPDGFKTVFFDTYGGSESDMKKDLVYYTEDGNLITGLETHVVIHNFKDGSLYSILYIKDTKEVDSDEPIHIADYDEGLIETYSSTIDFVQTTDVDKIIDNSSSSVVDSIEDDELSKAKADQELCQKVRDAFKKAEVDAVGDPGYLPFQKGYCGDIDFMNPGGTVFLTSFNNYLGINNPSDLRNQIQTLLGKKQGKLSYYCVSDTDVIIYIDNTDINGSVKDMYTLNSTDCHCIYAGPIELYSSH